MGSLQWTPPLAGPTLDQGYIWWYLSLFHGLEGTFKDHLVQPPKHRLWLHQVAQSPFQTHLEYFQWWKYTTSLGNLFLHHTTLIIKKILPYIQINLPSFSLKPPPIVLPVEEMVKSFSLISPLYILKSDNQVSPESSFLQDKQKYLHVKEVDAYSVRMYYTSWS